MFPTDPDYWRYVEWYRNHAVVSLVVDGSASAPVTFVEISDFECEFCGRYVQQTAPQIVTDYVQTGKIKYAFIEGPDKVQIELVEGHAARQ